MAIFWPEPPPNRGVECRCGRLKSRNQRLYRLAINNCCTVVCISHSAVGFLFTLGIGLPSAIDALQCAVRDRPGAVSGYAQSRWRWMVCMTASLDITPTTAEQNNRIVRTGKSEAEVTNNKKTALKALYYWSYEKRMLYGALVVTLWTCYGAL